MPNWETFIVYLAEMMVMKRSMMTMMMRRNMLEIMVMMMMMMLMLMMMMMMMTILVWCEREVNTGDVEVDVGQAGERGNHQT